MAISESPISSTPISSQETVTPAGPPVFRDILRLAIPQQPHESVLSGKTLRRLGFPEDVIAIVITTVQTIRVSRPIYPDPSVMDGGKTTRRFGIPEDIFAPSLTLPRIRVSRPVYPDPDVLNGNVLRIPGFPADLQIFSPPGNRIARQAAFDGDLLRGYITRREGRTLLVFITCDQEYVQNYRVADTAFDRFELWVGEDALPNLATEPQKVSSTLPFTFPVAAPLSGTKTIFAIVRDRSKYGVISGNQQMTIFVIDTGGLLEFAPPGPPVQMQLFPDAIGKARVFLRYNLAADGANPADTWEVFATEGSDPDPDVDTPAHTSTIVNFGGAAYLSALISPFTPGATLHVIGSVLRASDGKRGVTVAQTIVLPLAPSIDSNKATPFGGEVHEIR